MNKMIAIKLPNKKSYEFEKGITLQDILKHVDHGCKWPVMGAKIENDVKELTYAPEDDCEVVFIDMSNKDGMRIYKRTAVMVMIIAAKKVLPDARIMVMQSMSNALYCEIKGIKSLSSSTVRLIEDEMKRIVDEAILIEKIVLSTDDAIKLYEDMEYFDKVELLKYRKMPDVNVYKCGEHHNYFYGFMAPDTSYISLFRLNLYSPGFILEYPSMSSPDRLNNYVEQGKLAHIYFESNRWGERIDVRNIADLNKTVENGGFKELVKVCESQHSMKIHDIANQIYQNRDRLSVVLIAGPSSSGKTTFSKRLAIQLKVLGLNPVAISMDDYFVNRADCPVDENGDPDFESIFTIDIPLFNENISKLIQYEPVDMPTFDFVTGNRKKDTTRMHIKDKDLIIIEGIHALNDVLTRSVPKWQKFKIYVSALTHLNIDDHSSIPPTDIRLIRRIVRDHLYRGSNASFTMSLWPKVRRAETDNIFPYQEDADEMFNTATAYELSVLKNHVEPLLGTIDRSDSFYSDSKRLRRFLSYVLPFDANEACVPYESIIREFLGGSCF